MENKDEIADYVSDKISEATGFCHKGFDLILADSFKEVEWKSKLTSMK